MGIRRRYAALRSAIRSSQNLPEENDLHITATPEYVKAIQQERYGRFRHTRPVAGHVGAIRVRRLPIRDDRPIVDQPLAA